MMDKLVFALHQYSFLGLFVIATYGWGCPVTGWLSASPTKSLRLTGFITVPLAIASGIGVFMIALFVFGALGYLNATLIGLFLLVGIGLAVPPILGSVRAASTRDSMFAGLRRIRLDTLLWVAIAACAGLYLFIKPLQPPVAFDELNYHLPYARRWAEQGALTVDEWLRYPLFAYNMDLLYAASLVLGNDVLPHLLHAMTCALTCVLLFGIAQRYMDRHVGVVAVIGLVVTTRWFWGNAYVDLGVMLFWSCAFACLALRHELGDRRFSYLAAFFAGIAVGIKYQALFYLPVFAVLALVVERRPGVVLQSLFVFIVTGGFWYLRNYLISGDPVHPIGGHIFGFWLWNADDLFNQYDDLDRVRDWPHWFLFPALGSFLYWRSSTPLLRGLLLTAVTATGIWYLVSGYSRYLIAVYPMLALLSAYFLVTMIQRILSSYGIVQFDPRLLRGFLLLLLVVVAMNREDSVGKYSRRVMANEQDRVAFLADRFAGYDLLRSAGDTSIDTLYQLGFEGERYYLGDSVRGDWFGPGRYSQVLSRSTDATALAQYLDTLGTDGLLLNLEREFVTNRTWDRTLEYYFAPVARSEKAVLYRRRPDTEADTGTLQSPIDTGGQPL